ncbi:MAG: lysine--tRNA ligase [Candidatus Yonathbacteria bacterium RIFOXYC1_FULL_52_10]|uniref:Lysine--tRNA ligase n=1 Tax=Candidatus Yonathbacteria bacterium RIFOXYD1_FULL_52_36 TaxID=1802730 RepID=A0A1G2SI09_9BACT|nr:MAG: lysine--tRNA ligase [Candidatus Yonathbacteria bacterium RIFOXYD1_FULL_52_36]OHA84824.1 MAG: lysine--tRNA ligase [Candidatus Yonathbacteria bacterium RIFOXYC1_FULL_52_10]
MATLPELRAERIKKLELLKEAGMDAYPVTTPSRIDIADAAAKFATLTRSKKKIALSGRIMSVRGQGALMFFDLSDGTGTFQGMLKKGETDEQVMELFAKTIDRGDFIWVKGTPFLTKTKAKTILVTEWTMLSKSLRPLPDKWAGLQDVEERFRRRYLDTLMADDVRERFIMRSRMVSALREFLDGAGYLEVETAMLQSHAGGATAEPFTTHHNALDIDLYLRIAPELFLKRLLVGGFPKVYEIGRNFRNEGIDVTHNPEFTMLEFYASYADAREMRAVTEKLFAHVAKKLFGKTKVTIGETAYDFKKSFATISFYDLLRRYALVSDPENARIEDLRLAAEQFGIEVEKGAPREKILDDIYKKTCRPKLLQPTFVVDYPVNYLPLAKRSPQDPALVDAFQLVVGGIEIVKAFSELNDPIDQAQRFETQDARRKEGDREAQTSDQEFLEAMEYGMPPAGGVGIGIERLALFFLGEHNIREVILFPTMRPRE